MSTTSGRAGFTREQIVANRTRPARTAKEVGQWLCENGLEQGVMSFTPNVLEKRAAAYAARDVSHRMEVREADGKRYRGDTCTD